MKTEEVVKVVKSAFDYLTTNEVLNFIMNVEFYRKTSTKPLTKEEIFINNLYENNLVKDNSFYHRLNKHSDLFLGRTLYEVYDTSWSEIKDLILEKKNYKYDEELQAFIEFLEENGNEKVEDVLPNLISIKAYSIAAIIIQLGIGRMHVMGTEYLEVRDGYLYLYNNVFYVRMYNNIYRIDFKMETFEYDEKLELDSFCMDMKLVHNELEVLTKEIRKTNMINILDFLNGKNVFTMEIETNGNVYMGLTNNSVGFNIKNRDTLIHVIEEVFEFKTIVNNGVMVYYRETPLCTKKYKQNL